MNAEGFHDDCIDLINTYCSRNSTDFEEFCDDWKQKGFHYVFYGHAFQHELLLYTENCFVILKNIFTGFTTTHERLATLYLMYAMYFKQPTKDFCKFRFTRADWTKMKSFYDAINTEFKYLQARAIFWRLWQGNAFRFVECDMEHYPETMQLHRLGNEHLGDFQKINSTILSSVKSLQNESKGLLSAIGTLQLGYNEMKEHFATNMSECAQMKSIDVIDGVSSHLEKIKKLFENQYGNQYAKRKTRAGPSIIAIDNGTTDFESDYNPSYSSFEESNDEHDSISERSEDEDCLNIGSKRYYLKMKALQNESSGLHRLKSSVVETSNSSKKTPKDRTHVEESDQPGQSISNTQPKRCHVGIDTDNGNIVINHPRKVYNRHSKQYISKVRQQFSESPSEVNTELDASDRRRSPRKRIKLK